MACSDYSEKHGSHRIKFEVHLVRVLPGEPNGARTNLHGLSPQRLQGSGFESHACLSLAHPIC